MEAPRFDVAEAFDADYLHFYAGILTDDVSDQQTDTLWQLLELDRGLEVLDLACGHGRIANRLAARGARVTGLDTTPLFLDLAREDARQRGVEVEYVHGDMRALPWRDRFDAAACVFTSFGYFGDEDNRRVLDQVHQALKPGGRLWVDTQHLPRHLGNFRPEVVTEADDGWMIDRNRYEPLTGRTVTTRTVLRAGNRRTFEYSVRLFPFTELRDWLLAAGFREVAGYSGRGEDLTVDSPRMVLVARL